MEHSGSLFFRAAVVHAGAVRIIAVGSAVLIVIVTVVADFDSGVPRAVGMSSLKWSSHSSSVRHSLFLQRESVRIRIGTTGRCFSLTSTLV